EMLKPLARTSPFFKHNRTYVHASYAQSECKEERKTLNRHEIPAQGAHNKVFKPDNTPKQSSCEESLDTQYHSLGPSTRRRYQYRLPFLSSRHETVAGATFVLHIPPIDPLANRSAVHVARSRWFFADVWK
ncbi:hypothetical protein BKA70DRAFT_1134699, partial [Coprinopsis sp. MPI-PUGE-AT-0042]